MITPQIKIIAFKEDEELARYSLEPGEYTVGRSASCNLQLKVDGVSREHARLIVGEDGGLALEDRGSANGTFVDQWRVRGRVNVQPNQTIKLGAVTLLQESSTAAENSAPVSLAAESGGDLPTEFHRVDRYDVGEELAKGAMGAILSARQATIRRTVAMKVMLGKAAASARHRLRFIEEAQITGQLEHPNIVPVHELGVDAQGQIFYTMKLVKGITLKKILQLLRHGVPETVAKYQLPALLTVFQKVCDALAFAHSKGVIHRDLKPANIMVGYFGEVLVMDWGLAKVVDNGRSNPQADNATFLVRQPRTPSARPQSLEHVSSARRDEGDAFATMDGAVIGTPHYMSPEQACGDIDNLDVRSDIFALGAILYELLTLELPFAGGTAQEIIEKIQQGNVVPPHTRAKASRARSTKTTRLESGLPRLPAKEVPESLSAVCMKALAHKPAHRYARVKDLQADLAAYQTGFVTTAEKAGVVKQLTLLLKRHKALASSTAAALLLLAGISAAFTIKVIGERNRAEQALANLRDSAPLYAAKASALIEKQQFDEALVNISAAITYRRGEANYHFLKGNTLQSLFRFPESRQAYSAALALDSNHVYARENLQLCDEIIRADAGRTTPSIRTATKLNALMRRQGRNAEAVALLSILNKDRKILFDTWTEVFAKAGLKNLSEFEFRLDEDGLFTVMLRERGIQDISFLRGMPVKTLHLENNGVTDISPLAGAPLQILFISGNPVADISPLRGMKLETFNAQGTNVKDLTPVAGMPLQHIGMGGLSSLGVLRQYPLTSADLSGGSYSDLSPLKGMALTRLRIANSSHVSDLSPLRGMPLEELTMESTRVSDISPLAGMRLKHINAQNVPLVDLSPLRGQPLETAGLGHIAATDFKVLSTWPIRELALQDTTFSDLRILAGKQLTKLDLRGTAVTDIAPLRGMPLKELYLAGTKVTELRPLTDIPTLERLTVPVKANDIELLRQLPKLEYLDTQRGTEKALKSAREFWKEYDATKKP